MVLEGKVALVTGGGRGIGAAIARRLADRGVRVVITGRSGEELDEVAAEIDGVAVRTDFSDRASVDALASHPELAKISVLVNNAGMAVSAPLSKVTDEMWDRHLEVNVTSAFRLVRALVPGMVQRGWGRVINVASNAGVSGYRYSTAYCASKHAMVGMTRALAVDLAVTGVTINAVCPGWVETKMAHDAIDRIAAKTALGADQARASLENMSPQRRMLEPEEVAHLVVMLCDEEARGIHGQALVIDGGAILK